MNRISNIKQAILGERESSTDTNKLYSILLDTQASTTSDNIYDITEKLLNNEKNSAKIALEQLWTLKKNLDESEQGTVDILINFYQEKLDILRSKEKHINKVSKDSRELLQEKRNRDTEIAIVTQEIEECKNEIDRLSNKMKELKVKEQELILIENQLKKEIKLNANEVVNGLYEIMLSSREDVDGDLSLENNLQDDTSNKNDENIDKNIEVKEDNEAEIESEQTASDERSTNILYLDSIKKKENEDTIKNYIHELEKNEKEPVTPFPKSVVKTTRGAVIGEYYYDPEVSKSRRHYIYNSNFFATYFINTVNLLNEKFDQTVYSEAIQLIEDVYKRMKEQSMLHFEISTNEILNRKALKELWNNMKQRLYNEVLVVCNRLKAKISALGSNYTIMLKEQMARYREM